MLMRGERCELQQLLQVQELGVGGMYAAHPKTLPEHLGGAEQCLWQGETERFSAKPTYFRLTSALFLPGKVSNLVSQRKTCLVCACINQSVCVSPSPHPSVSLLHFVVVAVPTIRVHLFRSGPFPNRKPWLLVWCCAGGGFQGAKCPHPAFPTGFSTCWCDFAKVSLLGAGLAQGSGSEGAQWCRSRTLQCDCDQGDKVPH